MTDGPDYDEMSFPPPPKEDGAAYVCDMPTFAKEVNAGALVHLFKRFR